MKILFPLLAIIGGIAVAIQGQINGGLGKKVGVFEASFVSFAIGTLALLFAVLFFGKGNLLVLSNSSEMAAVRRSFRSHIPYHFDIRHTKNWCRPYFCFHHCRTDHHGRNY